MEFCMQLYLGVGILLGLAVLSLFVMAVVCIRKKMIGNGSNLGTAVRSNKGRNFENSEDGTYTGLRLKKVADDTYDTIEN